MIEDFQGSDTGSVSLNCRLIIYEFINGHIGIINI